MIAYFPLQDKIVNTETIEFAEQIGRTDRYHESHVVIYFVGGSSLEFPPEVTLHEVYTTLNERSTDG